MRHVRLIAVLGCLLAGSYGCAGDGAEVFGPATDTPMTTSSNSLQQIVGPSGATMTVDAAIVEVTPGALADSRSVELTSTSTPTETVATVTLSSPASATATLSLRKPYASSPGPLVVEELDPVLGWVPTDWTQSGNWVSIELDLERTGQYVRVALE